MAYTLGSSSTPNATWGTYYNALGEIQAEIVTKNAFLTPFPLFGSDSDATDVYDYGGVIRRITVTIVKADSPTNLATFAQALMTLVQGDQSPDQNYPIDYVSNLLGTVKVKIDAVDFNYVAGQPTMIRYTIRMTESSSVG